VREKGSPRQTHGQCPHLRCVQTAEMYSRSCEGGFACRSAVIYTGSFFARQPCEHDSRAIISIIKHYSLSHRRMGCAQDAASFLLHGTYRLRSSTQPTSTPPLNNRVASLVSAAAALDFPQIPRFSTAASFTPCGIMEKIIGSAGGADWACVHPAKHGARRVAIDPNVRKPWVAVIRLRVRLRANENTKWQLGGKVAGAYPSMPWGQ
jgi:hypothetical protein